MSLVVAAGLDPNDVRLARGAEGLLGQFNDAGVLTAADVHVATRLGRIGGETDEAVLLAAALAVRAPRLGHVCTDLTLVRATATVDLDLPVDLQSLDWPDPQAWLDRLPRSPLVAPGNRSAEAATVNDRPLRLAGNLLYLDRYWQAERDVAADLRARAGQGASGVDTALLAAGLNRLFGAGRDGSDDQRLAAATAVLRNLAVVAGGPGTGKTTTVARILALLDEQAAAAGQPPPLVALAAPTGKAAARLEEAVHAEAGDLDVDEGIRARLLASGASTIHRLLGGRPDSRSRFRHHRLNRLPHDVVVIDETSMVALALMAKLLDAVRPGARLVLVGDPEQLASVEAGAVLGDIVGPARLGARLRPPAARCLAEATGLAATPGADDGGAAIGDSVVVLQRVHRFGGGIAALADAIRGGSGDEVVALLAAGSDDVTWLPVDAAEPPASLTAVRDAAVSSGREVLAAARAGRGTEALAALAGFRLLCAHRRGAYGVAAWTTQVEAWLAAAVPGYGADGLWYVGRPLLVTENDYGLRLFNGDTGVVVQRDGGRVAAVFERRRELLEFSPNRLAAAETVHAMTVHKSQGSQFQSVAVLLPAPDSPILTRELLYTAVTRARSRLLLAGTEESVRTALERPVSRASGLRNSLWDQG